MALQEKKCDCCGTTLIRDDWDGQYYLENNYVWNRIEPYIDEEDVLVCTEQCFLDDDWFSEKYSYILHIHQEEDLCDSVYKTYKDGNFY